MTDERDAFNHIEDDWTVKPDSALTSDREAKWIEEKARGEDGARIDAGGLPPLTSDPTPYTLEGLDKFAAQIAEWEKHPEQATWPILPNAARRILATARLAFLSRSETPVEVPALREINWLATNLPDKAQQREYAKELAPCFICGDLEEAIASAGGEVLVAKRMGVPARRLRTLLRHTDRLTIAELADILWACDREVHGVTHHRLGVSEVRAEDAVEWDAQHPENPSTAMASLTIERATPLGGAPASSGGREGSAAVLQRAPALSTQPANER